jgi:hypothetical protein
LHEPEQQPIPASPPGQPSPEARHTTLESSAHEPLLHDREQHSSSPAHRLPITLQTAPPHTLA